jgi:hypothetical protein
MQNWEHSEDWQHTTHGIIRSLQVRQEMISAEKVKGFAKAVLCDHICRET